MITYDYFENQSLEDLNALGAEGWNVSGIVVHTSPQSFDAFVKMGFEEKTMVDNGSDWYFDKTITIGDSIMITLLTMAFFTMVGILIFKFIFRKQ
jgi:hypothetical protein